MRDNLKSMSSSVGLFLFFVIVTIIVLFPLYYLVIASLQPSSEVFRAGMKLVFDPELWDWIIISCSLLIEMAFIFHGLRTVF